MGQDCTRQELVHSRLDPGMERQTPETVVVIINNGARVCFSLSWASMNAATSYTPDLLSKVQPRLGSSRTAGLAASSRLCETEAGRRI